MWKLEAVWFHQAVIQPNISTDPKAVIAIDNAYKTFFEGPKVPNLDFVMTSTSMMKDLTSGT